MKGFRYKAVYRACSEHEIRSIWRRLVKERDGHICRRCNTQISTLAKCGAHAHHIIPLREGGMDTIDNGATLCIPCHSRVHQNLKNGIGYMEALKAVPK